MDVGIDDLTAYARKAFPRETKKESLTSEKEITVGYLDIVRAAFVMKVALGPIKVFSASFSRGRISIATIPKGEFPGPM